MRHVRIDAHQHFWRYNAEQYPWIDARMQRIARDFLPDDLAPELEASGFDGAIAVQARGTLDETRFLLELAKAHPIVRGVVGWMDLCAPDLDQVLEQFAGEKLLKGLRHVVQDEPDERFLLRPDFQRGVQRIGEMGLVYDVLIYPRQLDAAVSFTAALPDQPFVLDHLAKPRIGEGSVDDWLPGFRALAQFENVACKVSGLVTEAKWNAWQPDDFTRYLDAALEAFGPDRLLFGSDWPVCLLAADHYAAVHQLVAGWAEQLSDDERAKLFGGNAARIYRIADATSG
ncbi:MAG: amidohydrolase family protein [Planctomycetes bacterium]|nr:amidohydrolase family protein [Planctomycetota bacterium]